MIRTANNRRNQINLLYLFFLIRCGALFVVQVVKMDFQHFLVVSHAIHSYLCVIMYISTYVRIFMDASVDAGPLNFACMQKESSTWPDTKCLQVDICLGNDICAFALIEKSLPSHTHASREKLTCSAHYLLLTCAAHFIFNIYFGLSENLLQFIWLSLRCYIFLFVSSCALFLSLVLLLPQQSSVKWRTTNSKSIQERRQNSISKVKPSARNKKNRKDFCEYQAWKQINTPFFFLSFYEYICIGYEQSENAFLFSKSSSHVCAAAHHTHPPTNLYIWMSLYVCAV